MPEAFKNVLKIALAGATLFALAVFLPPFFASTYNAPLEPGDVASDSVPPVKPEPVEEVIHLAAPEPLKAIYMTSCVAGTPSWRENLKKLIEETELNAVVIDIKDYTGIVSFPNSFPRTPGGRGCVVSDMKDFIKSLHESNIYVIGRISVFQDVSYTSLFPHLAVKSLSTGEVWKDYKGLSFVDVGAKEYWDYIVELSRASYAIGFDELNYDYIRYPSDGNMQDIKYDWLLTAPATNAEGESYERALSKSETLRAFYEYLHKALEDIRKPERGVGAKLSADLFGMTTTVQNDMGIGQLLEDAIPYFDYIAPMVYPSHYPKTWHGFANPAEHPYEVIKIAMSRAVERERVWNISRGNFSFDESGATTTPPSKMRPWLQDFNLGATYDAAKVRAQIQATYDVGLTSWMLWSAANRYTRDALLTE